jgi:multisubunit Na+/H+ antiporter MnhF subunit
MLDILILMVAFALALSLFRFLRGPTLTDRVVAFDVMSIVATALLVILSVYFGRSIYLDVALVFGLIGFLGTVVFGRFIEKAV